MSRLPQVPHLYAALLNGRPFAIVRASTGPEAREHVLEHHLTIEKLTPGRAYTLGTNFGLPIENAKPEYAEEDDTPQAPLFGIADMGALSRVLDRVGVVHVAIDRGTEFRPGEATPGASAPTSQPPPSDAIDPCPDTDTPATEAAPAVDHHQV